MSTKSQSTLESIRKYGWLTLIIFFLVCISLYIGATKCEWFLPAGAEIDSAIRVSDYLVNENSIALIVHNTEVATIHDLVLNVTLCSGNSGFNNFTIDLIEGEIKKVLIPCNTGFPVGAKFTSPIMYSYTIDVFGSSGLAHIGKGYIRSTVSMGQSTFDCINGEC